jgi:hypothetical protein
MVLDFSGSKGNLLKLFIVNNRNHYLDDGRDQAHHSGGVKDCTFLAKLRKNLDLKQSMMSLWVDNTCQIQEADVCENNDEEIWSANEC